MCVLLCLLMLWLLPESHSVRAAEQPSLEYQVKSAFLLNFTKFIDWPEAVFGAPDAPLSICIFGEDPFGPALDRIVEGETVNNHKLGVQRVRRLPIPSCQVLFISREEKDVARLLSGIPAGVLTVGEGDRFTREGGMIGFVIDNRRVRFDVNLPAAANAGLQVSSKLLNVARTVEK
jgi:hypothetical protein